MNQSINQPKRKRLEHYLQRMDTMLMVAELHIDHGLRLGYWLWLLQRRTLLSTNYVIAHPEVYEVNHNDQDDGDDDKF